MNLFDPVSADYSGISDELLEDWLLVLLNKSSTKRNQIKLEENAFDVSNLLCLEQSSLVEFILYSCQVFDFDKKVAVLSVQVFNLVISSLLKKCLSYVAYQSFDVDEEVTTDMATLSCHIDEESWNSKMMESLEESDYSSYCMRESKVWQDIKGIVETNSGLWNQWEQIVNYLCSISKILCVSSVTVANKLQSSPKIRKLCMDRIVDFLKYSSETDYCWQDILMAEHFALDAINFDIAPATTLYSTMELLIEIVHRHGDCVFDSEVFTEFTVDVLQCALVHKTELYANLWDFVCSKHITDYSSKSELQADELLLVSAIVSTSAHLHSPPMSDEFVCKLNYVTPYSEELLVSFIAIVSDVVD